MEETKIMEDFVPRDIALLLKEKGYDWDCRQVYDLMTIPPKQAHGFSCGSNRARKNLHS